MIRAGAIVALLAASPVAAQVVSPLAYGTTEGPTQAEVDAANTAAQQALAAAQAASTAASTAVKSVNGLTPNASGAVAVPIPDVSNLATTSALAAATSGVVKTVNGLTPTNGAVTVPVPTASTTVPPGVSDSGATGTMTSVYALANHTHASKARKIIATSAADGTYAWTFTTPFTAGTVPICTAVAEVAAGVTDVVNVQLVGTPTATAVNLLVNRTQRSVVSLIGLTVLSVPSSPGATRIHAICLEP
jgi:hypothetical protein